MAFFRFFIFAVGLAFFSLARADDGYRLWLRYDRIADDALRNTYAAAVSEIVVAETPPAGGIGGLGGGSAAVAREELLTGLHGLLGVDVPVVTKAGREGALIMGTARNPDVLALVSERDLRAAGEEG